jgi:hypothetical protein
MVLVHENAEHCCTNCPVVQFVGITVSDTFLLVRYHI